MLEQTTAFVSLKNIENNLSIIKSKLKNNTKIMVAVKADAYGHGAVRVSQALFDLGVRYFAVATIDEAIELREVLADAEILILGFTHPNKIQLAIENNIIQTVYSNDIALAFSEKIENSGKKLRVHLALDTGMGRIGFETAEDALKVTKLSELCIEGAFTHFSCADESSEDAREFTKKQFDRFVNITSELEKNGVELKIKHCANSAAIFKYPEYQLDMVRAGIVLYGLYPSANDSDTYKGVKPAMQLKAPISHIKDVDKGATISYGKEFIAPKAMRIATVPCGYADGVARQLAKDGYLLVEGKRAKILGRICMDQLMIDVTDIENISLLSEATIFGESGGECISADELARNFGTINYQIVCDVSKRVKREYI